MTSTARLRVGHEEFARYAFPPNELGYCGPADTGTLLGDHQAAEHTAHAQAFDGAWPYLTAIADALHEEYKAIVDAGFLLQIDDPRLATYYALNPGVSIAEARSPH